ncbi:MAG: universal stress protein [Bacillota bacterium]
MDDKFYENWSGYNKILLPLGHKADINNLTELVSFIIERKKGKVKFIHVIREGSYINLPREWREGAKRVTESHHKMMTYRIRSDREIVTSKTIRRGILETAFDMKAEAIILGWGPKPGSKISKMASHIMDNFHGDVLIYKNRGNIDQTEKVMYPVAKSPSKSRLSLIKHIVQGTGATLTLSHYVDKRDGSRQKGEQVLEQAKEKALKFNIDVETMILEGNSLSSSIREATEDFDLLVIGPSGDWWVYQTVFGRTTDKIAEAAQCSVLLHKYKSEEE